MDVAVVWLVGLLFSLLFLPHMSRLVVPRCNTFSVWLLKCSFKEVINNINPVIIAWMYCAVVSCTGF